MSKNKTKSNEIVKGADYRLSLMQLQVELVKLQKAVIKNDYKILVILEGRDSSGKDGTIKRIIKHLSPRETRVVALSKPSDREKNSWYFQRYVAKLPTAQEMVLFNRSWYNRAGVERIMGFCTKSEYEDFLETAPIFEQMLERSGIKIFKYYLDISKSEQKKRLKKRRTNPLTQWKSSPIDDVAIAHWKEYSVARDEMFARTHNLFVPWFIVRSDNKHAARLNLIKHLLSQIQYAGKDDRLLVLDSKVVFPYDKTCHKKKMIAP